MPAIIKVEDIVGLKEVVLKLIEIFFQRKDRLDERHTVAQDKLYLALNETRMYLADFRKGKVDREQEKIISRLWRESAVALRVVDQGLADRCLIKMDYWADQELWSEEEIKKAKISFDQVFRRARQVLRACKS
jgi:hypothetical protein